MAVSDETGEHPWSNWQVFDPVAEVLKTGSGPAIRLGGGRPVIAPEALVTPYQVDCEVFFEEAGGFAGVVFGAVDQDAYEVVYLCLNDANQLGGLQYDAAMGGSMTWQLFHGRAYQAEVHIVSNTWVKVSVRVYSAHIAVAVGKDTDNHIHVFRRTLAKGPGSGVGIWGLRSVLVRNVHWSGAPWRSFASHPKAFDRPEHLLESWECAPAGTESKPKDDKRWRAVRVEENGVVNLSALYPLSQQSVWVRTQITGRGREENIHLMLGFSDQMTLWLNHQLVFEGQWLFNPPDEDGRVRVDSQRIPVRIGPGLNTILAKIFVQESYGWGLIMAVDWT